MTRVPATALLPVLVVLGCGGTTGLATKEPDEFDQRTPATKREAVLLRHVQHTLKDQDDANTSGIVFLAVSPVAIATGVVVWDRKRDAGASSLGSRALPSR